MLAILTSSQTLLAQQDTAFSNHADSWEPQLKGLKTRVSFGPFVMLDIDKGKSKRIDRTAEENDLVHKTITTKKAHTESISILYNNTDTIRVDLAVISKDQVERRTTVNKLFSKASNEEKSEKNYSPTVNSFGGMEILLPGKDSSWRFAEDTTTSGVFGLRVYFGKIYSEQDTIWLNNAGNIYTRKKMKIAAYESYPKRRIWIRNDIDKNTIMILGAFIACYIRVYQ